MKFPSLKGAKVLAILLRKPLEYEVVRREGSHRYLESPHGYPPVRFSGHEGDNWPRHYVRKLFVVEVGLTEQDAMKVIKGKKL